MRHGLRHRRGRACGYRHQRAVCAEAKLLADRGRKDALGLADLGDVVAEGRADRRGVWRSAEFSKLLYIFRNDELQETACVTFIPRQLGGSMIPPIGRLR